ncbi:hypothetical protein DICVIV_07781 [Dictyocaulus viviparus]|uniref:Uncharacterized protein n=1 Tax=Dictyocaulus viviparus TaxID=29172 RepID=A0A0D8XNT0_DICVI|nr:hypothetical protein DICVIV_07781 [Dictyocaulus viviparus]
MSAHRYLMPKKKFLKLSQYVGAANKLTEKFSIVPLSSLISNHEVLAAAAVNFVGWEKVESMLPPCLQGRSNNDVILLVADELDCMSKRRINRIIQGEIVPSDSSSSETSGDDSESYDQDFAKSSLRTENMTSMPTNLEDNKKEVGREYFSDTELFEGVGAELDNLPDVNKP